MVEKNDEENSLEKLNSDLNKILLLKGTGFLKKTHEIKVIKKKIARILTNIKQKKN